MVHECGGEGSKTLGDVSLDDLAGFAGFEDGLLLSEGVDSFALGEGLLLSHAKTGNVRHTERATIGELADAQLGHVVEDSVDGVAGKSTLVCDVIDDLSLGHGLLDRHVLHAILELSLILGVPGDLLLDGLQMLLDL